MSQIQSYKNSRSFYYNETLEKKKDPPSPFFLFRQLAERGVLGSMASNSFAHRVCNKNLRCDFSARPSPPRMLKIPIYRGGENEKRGWYLGVDTVLMLISRNISEYKFTSLSREPDKYHSGTGYCEEPYFLGIFVEF